MSSKTRTRKTSTTSSTTGFTPHLRSVPDNATAAKVRTDTEDKLWEALHANPNSTAVDLSSAAKIGKSTAQKILVRWADDGSVTRIAGIAEGSRRAADRWAITEADATPADNAASADVTQADPITPVDPDATDTGDVEHPEDDPTEPTNTDADGVQTSDGEATDPTEAEPILAEATEPEADAPVDGNSAKDDGKNAKTARLAPGTLRGMVEDYLRDHPNDEFGPTAIAKALGGKSSGAVSNALDKLVQDKTAVKTKESPRRFALTRAE